jgi:hypothetical protein
VFSFVSALAWFGNTTTWHLDWVADHFWELLIGLFLFGYGVLGVLRPDVVLKWVAAAQAGSSLDQTARR